MKRLTALTIAITIGGCVEKTDQPPSRTNKYQAVLNGIADRCGVSRKTFEIVGEDYLTVHPPALSDPQSDGFECAYRELLKAGLPLKLGFTGNEYYVNEAQ